jgi:hypothetical protein
LMNIGIFAYSSHLLWGLLGYSVFVRALTITCLGVSYFFILIGTSFHFTRSAL